MRLLYKIITSLILALGCLHIGFTPFNYSRFDMDAMWFVNAGVVIILAGFLNVAVIREAGKDNGEDWGKALSIDRTAWDVYFL